MLQQNHKKKREVKSSNINKTKRKQEHNFKVVVPTHQKNNKTHKKSKALIVVVPTHQQNHKDYGHLTIFEDLTILLSTSSQKD
jgi:hypothetical protein